MNEERVLAQLAPPPGGWQRLLTRRDAPAPGRGQQFGVPLATAAALALVVLLLRPQTHELHLPWNGGRLIAQPSEGVALRVGEQGRATAQPSDDPRVRFYWLQETGARGLAPGGTNP